MDKYLKLLVERLEECIKLSVPEDKASQMFNLIERHKDELYQLISSSVDAAFIKSKFSNFINKVLSTIETIDLSETQYKALRKLVLSEIHGCLDLILGTIKNSNGTTNNNK